MILTPSPELLDDLAVRFILTLPATELESFERLLFSVEQAWWHYEVNTFFMAVLALHGPLAHRHTKTGQCAAKGSSRALLHPQRVCRIDV